jgi:pantoate--beta-alanine ligase
MYPDGFRTFVENATLADVFEGKERPGHFKGVATIVLKLLLAVKPHVAVFGQKDAQQLALVRAMTRDLNIGVDILAAPIARDNDGLALSSRNVYLDAERRSNAVALSRSLVVAKELVGRGVRSARQIEKEVRAVIEQSAPDRIDYIACVDPDSFKLVDTLGPEEALLILAVRYGETRLLDNIALTAQT